MTAETLCVPPHFNSTCSLSPKLTTTLNLAFSLFMFLIPIQSQFTYNTSKNSSPSPWYTFYSCGCYTLKNTNLLPHCFLIRKPWIQKKKKKSPGSSHKLGPTHEMVFLFPRSVFSTANINKLFKDGPNSKYSQNSVKSGKAMEKIMTVPWPLR